jgi:hypothetical protein
MSILISVYNEEGCCVKHDHDHGEDSMTRKTLKQTLEETLELENQLLRTYAITAEAIHEDHELKTRLHNMAEGNAKRVNQIEYELEKL